MEYFKHFTSAHESNSLMTLRDLYGSDGYAAWFILLEMCAQKMQKQYGGSFTEDDCKFIFSERLVREKLRLRSTKVELILNSCSTLNLLEVTKVEDKYHFYIPKLLESLDRDQRRARRVRDNAAEVARLEERSKNIRNKNVRNKKLESSESANNALQSAESFGSKLFKVYSEAFLNRYGVTPTRNAKVNKNCQQIYDRLGEDAFEVAKFFLTHNDSFYLRAQHPIGSLLRDAESLHTQWKRGQAVTSAHVKQFEKQSVNLELMEKVKRGEV
jgi:hypothetical protein